MFHNVVPTPDLHLNPRNISTAHFRKILLYIRKHYRVVSLEELKASDEKGLIAITFDDGLINNLRHAAPVLAECGLPATFFVCTPRLHGNVRLWPDELSFLLKNISDQFEFQGKTFIRKYRNHFREVETETKLEDVLLRSAQPEINQLLEHLRKQVRPAVLNEQNEDFWRVMKGEEVKLLAAMPGVAIGSHGISHRNLTLISEEELQEELTESKKYLSAAAGNDVVMLAWPFGQCNAATCDYASKAGFTLQAGVIHTEGDIAALDVPFRLGIYNDKDPVAHLHQINLMMR
jgi:peptidoglycan/xylan/chitin deacetylase (PgdA/CDA1 family)